MFSHFSTVFRSCLFLIRSRAIYLRFWSDCLWYMSVHKNRPHTFTCSVLCDPIEIKWVHTYVWSYVVAVTLWRVRVCVDNRQWMEIVLACYIHTLREIHAHARDASRLPYLARGSFFSFLFSPHWVVSLWYSQSGGQAGESFAIYAPELQTCILE